jgi:hypothetical protein
VKWTEKNGLLGNKYTTLSGINYNFGEENRCGACSQWFLSCGSYFFFYPED